METWQKGSFVDERDGQKYMTIKIPNGTVWMAQNLNYDASGSSYYAFNPVNAKIYGRLYDWKTAMNACPRGWHLASRKEWQTLVDYAGGNNVAGKNLKAKSGWRDNKGKTGNGIDAYGFSALPGGYRGINDEFFGIGCGTIWWTSTKYDNNDNAYNRDMSFDSDAVLDYGNAYSGCFSVRCVQD